MKFKFQGIEITEERLRELDAILAEAYAERIEATKIFDSAESQSIVTYDAKGYFVYAWFDGDVPFYIGIGMTKARFKSVQSRNEACNKIRKDAKEFRVQIMDGLTEVAARLIEGAMIRLLNPVGNIARGARPQELQGRLEGNERL